MGLFKLIYILYQIKLLTPLALWRLISSINTYGINLMALLRFSARTYGESIVLVDEQVTLTYKQLFEQVKNLSMALREEYQLTSGKKVGLLSDNHASLVQSIFAVSSSGADVYLLNTKMSKTQFNNILEQHNFDLLIYDEEHRPFLEQSSYSKARILSYHDTLPSINILSSMSHYKTHKRHRTSSSKLVLLTGGTTGNAKEAAHKPSLFNYLNPFADFLSRLKILNYDNAYIATPIYHGYGLGVLLLFIAVGKKLVIRRGFHAEKACHIIRAHQIEVITVVPLMLHKMLKTNAEDLKSLKCIASGSAELNPKLVKETLRQLGGVLYNLYGTSETGLITIATPADLSYAPNTIGKKIKGIRITVLDENNEEVEISKVGQFSIKNSWSTSNSSHSWIQTGDLGYRDEQGNYYLSGRVDSMIVSAGENVYPLEVQQVLLSHPQVEDAAVIGIRDEHFGQRLKAYVVLTSNEEVTTEELVNWLRPKLARFQLPKEIILVDHLPYTPLGKLDMKLLKEGTSC